MLRDDAPQEKRQKEAILQELSLEYLHFCFNAPTAMMKITEGARSLEVGRPPVKLNPSSSVYWLSEDVDIVPIVWLFLLFADD